MDHNEIELSKLKIKRAHQLVASVTDMHPGDAAVMFMLAAIEAQYNATSEAAKELAHEDDIKAIMETSSFQGIVMESVDKVLKTTLLNSMIAFTVIREMNRRGTEI